MSYQATVIPIMIASPGDVLEESSVVRDVINEWNYINAGCTKTISMPVRWETHVAPELGGRPQELINNRILKECDLLVGIFWTRLGTPTGVSASGTVEEVELHIAAKKPAMLYFSAQPVAPQSIDQAQFAALTEFKKRQEINGIVWSFDNISDLKSKFSKHLQITFNSNEYIAGIRGNSDNLSLLASQADENGPFDLSEEAKELLLSVSLDRSGAIMKVRTLSGLIIQSNGRKFGDSSDRLSMARWEYALEQLVTLSLVVPRGYKGDYFEITQQGYSLVDGIRSEKLI